MRFHFSVTVQHDAPEFPLGMLQTAIESQDECNAWNALANQRIRSELVCSTTTHKVPSGSQQQKCNVFTCVEAAVHCNMPRIVLAMYQLSPADVRLATWYALYNLKSKHKTKRSSVVYPLQIASELANLARSQRKIWLWERVGPLLLVRNCDILARKDRGSAMLGQTKSCRDWEALAAHPITRLPDLAFGLILSFVALPEAKEARILRFLIEARLCQKCSRLCIPGKCKAKRLRRMERRGPKARS
ncbi:hypothetical protein BBJ28_00002009 [Nothophytophthora sp. Chile5]|nr:hypothetical protein BBJ28_00002009 [Nothophytophthora sp. Chile5]